MAAKGVTFITNILLIILLVQQYSTNSFYSLFLQYLNFSPSHLGFVRVSQIWTSALLVPAWMLLTKEHLTAQGKRIVIATCVIALMGFYMSLVFFPHSMSCLLRDVTHCHSIPSLNGISKDTQRAAVHFNNISVFNQSNKTELLPTESTTTKYNSLFLTNLPGKTLSNYSQVSSEPNESNTTKIPKANTTDSLNEFNHNSSKNLSSDTAKEMLLKHKQPLFVIEEKQAIPQTPERRTSTEPPDIYLSPEMTNIVHNSNVISDKLKQKMMGANEKSLLHHHYFVNNHHTPTVAKSGRKKQKIYSNSEVPVNNLNQYYSETSQENSYLQDKNEHYWRKYKPILDLLSYKHKKLSRNNVPSSYDKNQRLKQSSNSYLKDQLSYPAALSKAHRFMNTPYTTFSKKKQENEISGTGLDEKYPHALPEFSSSFNTKHNSYKPLNTVLPDNRYKVNFAGQVTDEDDDDDEYDDDLGKVTYLEKADHVIQEREELEKYLTKEKTLHSNYPYREKHEVPRIHDLKTLQGHSTNKRQNKRVRRSDSKADRQMKCCTSRSLKSVEDLNDSYVSRTEINNGTKITRFLSFSSGDTYTFSFVFCIIILAEIFSKGITSVCKRICTENAAADPCVFNFGLQQWAMKTWGIVVCPVLTAIVVKLTCVYQPRVFLILAAFLLIINTPLILFMLPTPNKTEKGMPLKSKNFKSSVGSHFLVLVSGFGTACNFEFIFWHIDLQQDFTFNYQLLYCGYVSLRAIAQTSVQPSVEHWQEEDIINKRRTRVLWSTASHAALCLHSLGASYLHPTWTLILLGLLMGCSDSFQNSETARAWWTTGYGFGCLLGGCIVDSYGTQLLFQGVAIVMFTSCIVESTYFVFSKYYGCGCKRQAAYSKLLLLPEGEDSSEEEIMEYSDDWLERALQKDELKQKKLQCIASV